MQKIHILETKSTNTFIIDSIAKGGCYDEYDVIYTQRQTAGRGQMGNSWESQNDRNIAFSMLLRPSFLPIREQFVISEIACLAIAEALDSFGVKNVSVKWPNDIYCGDDKICGMLIENSLTGSRFSQCIVGIGINVNQEVWIGNAPNPTSMLLKLGQENDPVAVMDKVIEGIIGYYEQLKQGKKEAIHSRYLARLYRREGFFAYQDAESGKPFMARIKTIEPSGHLQLEDPEGSTYRYMFKEVRFVLPCGVTKE